MGNYMKKINAIITAYIASKNEQDAFKYENKLLVHSVVPLMLLAAILNLIVFNIIRLEDSRVVLTNSLIWLLFVAALLFIPKLSKSERLKSYITISLLAALTVFFVLRYYQLVGPAVWSFTGIIIMFAMTRNDRVMVVVMAFLVVLLGFYVWFNDLPSSNGAAYYIAQIVSAVILVAVALCVQKLNSERYKKIRYHLHESEMVSQLSSDFITVSAENLDTKINAMLAKSGLYYGADIACVFLLSKDGNQLKYTHEWVSERQSPLIGRIHDFDVYTTPWCIDLVEDRKVWIIPNVDEMDIREMPGKTGLQNVGIKSMISMPIIVKDKVCGVLFYESLTKYLHWKNERIKLLDVLTNMLADAILKVEDEKEINYMAYYDTLTGLPNRIQFNMKLDEAIESARMHNMRLAVMFIDLDSFKSVNDLIGHEGGDALLRQVGLNIKEQLGDHGIVGRQGGDEFVILLPNINETDNVREFADHVMAAFHKPVTIDNQEFFVTASAGVAIYPYDGLDSNTLRKNADLVMYSAKELGKNQAVFCTSKLKDDFEQKVRITNLLHRAQEKNELVIYYQPLVDVASQEVVGVEALLRWMQPELGMIPPSVFVPLAEQTGLIFPIGKWVLKEACLQNKAWQDAGYKPIRMAVNLSIEQFRRKDLADMINEVLDETGLDAKFLELEITESVASKDMNDICGILTEIRELGVSIAIDDFGTEYSSLSRIKRLPVDRIKMAMEFVHGISVSDKDEAIVKVIINLANNLGLKVIAEGVETENQYEFLRDHICDEVQGYYFFKPMPAHETEKTLLKDESILVSTR